jgi:hypothetical protein
MARRSAGHPGKTHAQLKNEDRFFFKVESNVI